MTEPKKKKYVVASPEGASHAWHENGSLGSPPKIDDVVELALSEETEAAVLAAGWFTDNTGPKGGSK